MLCRGTIYFCLCENRTKHINAQRGQNARGFKRYIAHIVTYVLQRLKSYISNDWSLWGEKMCKLMSSIISRQKPALLISRTTNITIRHRGSSEPMHENNRTNNWFMFSLIETSHCHRLNALLYSSILKQSQREGHPALLVSTYHRGSVQAHPCSLERLITIQKLRETWTQKLRSRSCLWRTVLSLKATSYIFKSLRSVSGLEYHKH
jgi:hypothetical protein